MRILVSMRMVDNSGYPERRDAISQDWSRLFARYGIIPILVPNMVELTDAYFDLGARGLLLTGGDDIGPLGQPTPRDLTETRLIDLALQLRMPILGVCRGLQVLNRHFGGKVTTTLSEPHVGDHGAIFADGTTAVVNSFHNQGVLSSDLAPGLSAFCWTAGGVIEGVRHRDFPITAIQWHPERSNPAADRDAALIREWLAECE